MSGNSTPGGEWWKVDLGGVYDVDHIKVYNAYLRDVFVYYNRLPPFVIQLQDVWGNVLMEKFFYNVAYEYSWVNDLLMSSFKNGKYDVTIYSRLR